MSTTPAENCFFQLWSARYSKICFATTISETTTSSEIQLAVQISGVASPKFFGQNLEEAKLFDFGRATAILEDVSSGVGQDGVLSSLIWWLLINNLNKRWYAPSKRNGRTELVLRNSNGVLLLGQSRQVSLWITMSASAPCPLKWLTVFRRESTSSDVVAKVCGIYLVIRKKFWVMFHM